MTLLEQKRKYRQAARRFKTKYLVLKHKVELAKFSLKKISLGKQILLVLDGKVEEVVRLSDVEELLEKCLSDKHDNC